MNFQLVELDQASKILRKTRPFLKTRLTIMAVFSIVAATWILLSCTLFKISSSEIGFIKIVALMAGAMGPVLGFYRLKKLVLNPIQSSHIAVMTMILKRPEIFESLSEEWMIECGKEILNQRFHRPESLDLVEYSVDGTVRTIHGFYFHLRPVAQSHRVSSIWKASYLSASDYVDSLLLSYNLSRPDEDIWISARNGLIHYAQNAHSLLPFTLRLMLLSYAGTIALILLSGVLSGLIYFIAPSLAVFLAALLVFTALGVRVCIFDPLIIAALLFKFHSSAQEPSEQRTWHYRLNLISNDFRDITHNIPEALEIRQAV